MIYGKISPNYLSKIITDLLLDSNNAVVISSDLSHFYSEERARQLDHICLDGVASLDNHKLNQGCEACGLVGIKAMVESAKNSICTQDS